MLTRNPRHKTARVTLSERKREKSNFIFTGNSPFFLKRTLITKPCAKEITKTAINKILKRLISFSSNPVVASMFVARRIKNKADAKTERTATDREKGLFSKNFFKLTSPKMI